MSSRAHRGSPGVREQARADDVDARHRCRCPLTLGSQLGAGSQSSGCSPLERASGTGWPPQAPPRSVWRLYGAAGGGVNKSKRMWANLNARQRRRGRVHVRAGLPSPARQWTEAGQGRRVSNPRAILPAQSPILTLLLSMYACCGNKLAACIIRTHTHDHCVRAGDSKSLEAGDWTAQRRAACRQVTD